MKFKVTSKSETLGREGTVTNVTITTDDGNGQSIELPRMNEKEAALFVLGASYELKLVKEKKRNG